MKLTILFLFLISLTPLASAQMLVPTSNDWESGDEQSPAASLYRTSAHGDHVTVEDMILLHKKTTELTKSMSADTVCASCKSVEAKSTAPKKTPTFETYETCKSERNYFQETFSQLKTQDVWKPYLETRSASKEAQIPRECVTYVMRGFLSSGNEPSESFASCPDNVGLPRQGQNKACVTEDYVNIVYNSFVDVADCMGLSQKMMVPKFMNESGMHINSFGYLKVLDKKKGKMKSVLDIKVCMSKDQKLTDLKEIPDCNAKVREKYLADEAIEIKKAAKSKDKEQLKKWRESRDTQVVSLRTVFDHKTASDSWLDDLSKILDNPVDCKKKLVESICAKDQTSLVGGDAGIGQITKPAAEEIAKHAKDTEEEIRKSKKPSCKRLASLPNIFDSFSGEIEKRCDFIRTPPNPTSSLIRYGILLRSMRSAIDATWNNRKIDNLMASAGISAQEKKVKETLALLAYNAGPSTAVILFENWLKARATNTEKPLSGKDLSISSSTAKSLTPKKSAKANQLDFGTYLKIYRDGWAKGYLNFVKDAADRIDRELGKNKCTPKDFLQL